MRGKKCKVGKYAPKCVGKSAKVESMHQNPEKSKNNRNTAPKGNQIIIPYSIKSYFEKRKIFNNFSLTKHLLSDKVIVL